jgi:hypothetical protein
MICCTEPGLTEALYVLYIHSVTCCRKPEYGNEDIRPSLDNGFDNHVPAATEKPVTIQQLAGLDVFRR